MAQETHEEFMKQFHNPPKIIKWSDDIDMWSMWFMEEIANSIGATQEEKDILIPALCAKSMKG